MKAGDYITENWQDLVSVAFETFDVPPRGLQFDDGVERFDAEMTKTVRVIRERVESANVEDSDTVDWDDVVRDMLNDAYSD
jgi:hypothetical protein